MADSERQLSGAPEAGDRPTWRVRARGRYDGSVVQEVAQRLAAVHFVNTIVLFGAAFLLSTLPFIILMSSVANQRIDDDLARHLGLNGRATQVVEKLFHPASRHSVSALIVALLIGFAGTLAVAGSVQSIYEEVFDQHHSGSANIVRLVMWIVGLGGWLILDGFARTATRHLPGSAAFDALVIVAATSAFFWWSMHFLLAGKVSWRALLRPAAVTGVLWIALDGFSALYFSSSITSDSQLYGTIGVVFSLLTWFIAIAAVVVLGSLVGEIWQRRHVARTASAGQESGSPLSITRAG